MWELLVQKTTDIRAFLEPSSSNKKKNRMSRQLSISVRTENTLIVPLKSTWVRWSGLCVCGLKYISKSMPFACSAVEGISFSFLAILAELWRAKRACGAPWVSKSTHPRKFGNHVTVHRPPARPSAPQGNQCLILTLSSQFGSTGRLILHTYIAHQCCDQLAAVKTVGTSCMGTYIVPLLPN